MDTPLSLGKKQVLPCVISNFGVWFTSQIPSFGKYRQTLWYQNRVLSNVPSDGYEDLDRTHLLQGRHPLGKEPVSFQNSGWQSRERLSA